MEIKGQQNIPSKVPVLVGVDIEPDNVQISWYGRNMKEPETIGLQVGVDKYKFPFCIFYDSKENEYYIGQTAIENMRDNKEGVFLPALWHDAKIRKKVSIKNKMVSAVMLLQEYFIQLLRIVETFSGSGEITAIAYTSKVMDEETINLLKQASQIFIDRGIKMFYKSYAECYVAYLLNQPEEMYARNSVLFYMSKGVLDIFSVSVNKRYKPYPVVVQNDVVKGFEAFDDIIFCTDEEKELMDKKFFATAKELFGSAIISTVFLTGDGFDKEWLNNSIKFLCQGRRVFQGKNLFTKGACYFLIDEYSKRIYNLNGENRLVHIFKMPMWQNGNSEPYVVYNGDGDWYQVDKTIECILDKCDEILLEIIVPGKEALKRTEILKLKDIPVRQNRGTKVKINVKMLDKNTLKIHVKDEGLGEFFKASNKEWEKIIEL